MSWHTSGTENPKSHSSSHCEERGGGGGFNEKLLYNRTEVHMHASTLHEWDIWMCFVSHSIFLSHCLPLFLTNWDWFEFHGLVGTGSVKPLNAYFKLKKNVRHSGVCETQFYNVCGISAFYAITTLVCCSLFVLHIEPLAAFYLCCNGKGIMCFAWRYVFLWLVWYWATRFQTDLLQHCMLLTAMFHTFCYMCLLFGVCCSRLSAQFIHPSLGIQTKATSGAHL